MSASYGVQIRCWLNIAFICSDIGYRDFKDRFKTQHQSVVLNIYQSLLILNDFSLDSKISESISHPGRIGYRCRPGWMLDVGLGFCCKMKIVLLWYQSWWGNQIMNLSLLLKRSCISPCQGQFNMGILYCLH